MRRNLVIITLILSLVLTNLTTTPVLAAEFSDIDGHWAEENIEALVDLGIINGFGDGTFRPDDTVTVEQFIKMVVMATGEDVREQEDGEWWSDRYIETANDLKIISTGDTFYGGVEYNEAIERDGMAMISIDMLINVFDEDIDIIDGVEEFILDYDEIGLFYSDSVLGCFSEGIITGYDDDNDGYTVFKPEGYLTRAEATTVIMRLLYEDERIPYDIGSATDNSEWSLEEIMYDSELSELVHTDKLTFNADGSITIANSKYDYTTTVETGELLKDLFITLAPNISNDTTYIAVLAYDSLTDGINEADTLYFGAYHTGNEAPYFLVEWDLDDFRIVSEGTNENYDFMTSLSRFAVSEEEEYNTYTNSYGKVYYDTRCVELYKMFIETIGEHYDFDGEKFADYLLDEWYDFDTYKELIDTEGTITEYVDDIRIDRTASGRYGSEFYITLD